MNPSGKPHAYAGTEISLYRLIQESLNNVMKHADASHVAIRLTASFPNLILRIEDDGKGFDVRECMAPALKENGWDFGAWRRGSVCCRGK